MHADERTTGWDRAGLAAVVLLLGAFVLGAITPLASTAGAEDSTAAKRDDDSRELVGVEDDDDDDGDSGTNGGGAGSGSGSPKRVVSRCSWLTVVRPSSSACAVSG